MLRLWSERINVCSAATDPQNFAWGGKQGLACEGRSFLYVQHFSLFAKAGKVYGRSNPRMMASGIQCVCLCFTLLINITFIPTFFSQTAHWSTSVPLLLVNLVVKQTIGHKERRSKPLSETCCLRLHVRTHVWFTDALNLHFLIMFFLHLYKLYKRKHSVCFIAVLMVPPLQL